MRRFLSSLLLLLGAACDLAPKRPSPPTETYIAQPAGILQLAPGAIVALETPSDVYTIANADSAVHVWKGERFLGGVAIKDFASRDEAMNSSPDDSPVFSDGTCHIVFVWRSDVGKMTVGVVFSGALYPSDARRGPPLTLPRVPQS